MKIAVPVSNGRLCMHFGHCEQFALVEANPDTGQILKIDHLVPPPHEPGVLPRWLHEQGANVIIAGGMGQRAQQLFTANNIQVVVGAPSESAYELALAYLQGTLKSGVNACDH
ncbi:MAG: hypothetical protein AMXMBFR13_07720 [Phycisphaerae bacterium]